MIARVRGITAAVIVSICCCAAPAESLPTARAAAHAGKVDAAVAALAGSPKTAEADSLLCSLYASIERRDEAVTACEAAAVEAPSNSTYALELARAYGEKASHSGALTGMRMVGRIRSNFERAVQRDGNSVEALSDLGQFYVEAPGVVGGGADKARALLPRLQALSPARGHRLAGMIAVKAKDDVLAEQEFQAELAVSHSAEAYVDLANFYRSRKQWDKAAEQARLAMEHDIHHGPDTLDAANLLIELKRDAAVAQTGLRSYLQTPQTGVAAYARVHVLLARSLSAAGDSAGAQAEYKEALALARDFEAARQGLAR